MNLQQQAPGPQAGPGLGQTPAPQAQTDPVGVIPQPSPQGDPLAGLTGQHDQLLATFKKLQAAGKTLGSVRKVLDTLMKSGDMVKPEDVVSGAADLVGSGLTPKALVGLMADIPSGGGDNAGSALQAWIAQHDVDVTGREQQLLQVKSAVGHQLAVAGLKALMGHALMQHTRPATPPQDDNHWEQFGGMGPGGNTPPQAGGGAAMAEQNPENVRPNVVLPAGAVAPSGQTGEDYAGNKFQILPDSVTTREKSGAVSMAPLPIRPRK